MDKRFMIPDDRLRPLVSGKGTCRIPDSILVMGKKVTYFYRVMPEHHTDSGWRFRAGDETEEYLSRPELNGTYDLNIAANYCPSVIPLLDAPPYSAFQYDPGRRKWVDVTISTDWSELI